MKGSYEMNARKLSSYWFELTQEDTLEHGDDFAPGVLSYWHKRGYLSSSLVRWGTEDLKKNECISDFDYMSLLPMNTGSVSSAPTGILMKW